MGEIARGPVLPRLALADLLSGHVEIPDLVHIRRTPVLDELMITPNLLAEGDGLERLADRGPLPLFDHDDRLVPWSAAEPRKVSTP